MLYYDVANLKGADKKPLGDDYANALGYWTEGFYPPTLSREVHDWLSTSRTVIRFNFAGNAQGRPPGRFWALMGDELLANLGGDRDDYAWLEDNVHVRCNHGWPWTVVVRDRLRELVESETDPTSNLHLVTLANEGLAGIGLWSITTGVAEFRVRNLFANMIVALAILAAVAVGCESLCKRNYLSRRYRLRHIFVGTTVIAVLFGWMHNARATLHFENAIRQDVEKRGGTVTTICIMPDWTMVGGFELWGFRSHIVEVDLTQWTMSVGAQEKLTARLQKLDHLRTTRLPERVNEPEMSRSQFRTFVGSLRWAP